MTSKRYDLGSVTHDLRIQAYAFVMVLDLTDRRVVAYSDNLPDFLGADAGAMSSLNAGRLFSERTIGLAISTADRPYPSPIRMTADEPTDWGNRQLLSRPVADRLLLVVEPRLTTGADATTDRLQNHLLELSDELKSADKLPGILRATCRRIGLALSFDRVAAYQLEYEGGPGQISAEYGNGELPSLLSLHFRSDDLPPEAYEKHRYAPVLSFARPASDQPRMVGDYDEQTSAIVETLGCRTGFAIAERFLLENDLASQLNIAIRIDGHIWGILMGHSRKPRYLDRQHRQFARLIGIQVEREIATFAPRSRHRGALTIDAARAEIRRRISQAGDLQQGLTLEDPSLADYLPHCGGAAVLVDGRLSLLGHTPTADLVNTLLDWAKDRNDRDTLWHTNNLAGSFPEAADVVATAAGVLLAPLNKRSSEWIAWFRPESVEEVTYGSRPAGGEDAEKYFVATPGARRGFSLPWTGDQVAAARDLQSFVREVVMERYGQLRRMNEQLQSAYDEMEAFSYTVSHDLRAPLRGIDGFAEILVEDFGQELRGDVIELVRNIQHNAARMNQFITDILELSRVGRTTLIVNDCDVLRLVRESVADLEKQLNTRIEVYVQDDLPPIRGDHAQLRVVFQHLLSNAVRFTGREVTRRIEVGYRTTAEGGEFFVADNGIGIASQYHRRIFGMFNRLVTSEDYGGNGIGLAIARRILQRHGGEISVESQPGRGTTFFFYTSPPTGQTRT